MCFSERAPLGALAFLQLHLVIFAFLPRSTTFSRELQPFALFYCLCWIVMETFDYSLWQAHVQSRCYDLVTVSGNLTLLFTIMAINIMVWYV